MSFPLSGPAARATFSSTVALTAALAWLPADAGSVYVALGDSITFGETDLAYVPSAGDRGYVGAYADVLADRNGGLRPTVVNLAIDGETATSFFTGTGRTPPVVGRGDVPLAQQNLYYNTRLVPQATQLASTVATQAAAGNTIDTVTITLGFNEVAALASLPTADALARLPQTLADYRTNFGAVLADVRSLLPNAQLSVLGYFDPFPADPASPAAPIFAAGGVQLNGIIQELAGRFGANFVDTATAFRGNEAAYTYLDEMPAGSSVGGAFGGVLPIGNVHPNAAGYAAIATQVAAVPEPATWALMFAGALGLLAFAPQRSQKVAVSAA